jgi:hypothetical protein
MYLGEPAMAPPIAQPRNIDAYLRYLD